MKKHYFNCKTLAILIIVFLSANSLSSQVVAEWRGTDRHGIYPETGLLTEWPATGPELLWSTDSVGNGYGSPVILDGKLYICGEVDSSACLFVYSTAGKLLHKVVYGKEWMVNYIGCRNAPTITKEAIYLSTGLGDLVCLDRETLSIKWRIDGKKDLHNQLPRFGHAESPAVEGNLVFFDPGGKVTNVVALDRFTGQVVWICKGDGERPGYNSPLVIRLPARTLLVLFSAYSLMGFDTKTGVLLWTHPQDNLPVSEHVPRNGDTHSNTVWYEDGTIFYIAGDGNGAVRLTLTPDGSSIKQVWRNQSVDDYMGGFIKTAEHIYACSDSKKAMLVIDPVNGTVTDSLKCGTGAMISDGNNIYYYNQRGEMELLKPGPDAVQLVSKFKVTQGTKEHFSHPVINNGVLYLRHGRSLMAWKIRNN